jgi:hypothetical protein
VGGRQACFRQVRPAQRCADGGNDASQVFHGVTSH